MSSPAGLICAVIGHRRSRTRTWNDNLDFRSTCAICGISMVRSFHQGWRPFRPSDASPLRISRDELNSTNSGGPSNPGDDGAPTIWARRLLVTFGDPQAVDPATAFDRLINAAAEDPVVVAAMSRGAIDAAAVGAMGTRAHDILRLHTPLPPKMLEQLAQYVFARLRVRADPALKSPPPPSQ